MDNKELQEQANAEMWRMADAHMRIFMKGADDLTAAALRDGFHPLSNSFTGQLVAGDFKGRERVYFKDDGVRYLERPADTWDKQVIDLLDYLKCHTIDRSVPSVRDVLLHLLSPRRQPDTLLRLRNRAELVDADDGPPLLQIAIRQVKDGDTQLGDGDIDRERLVFLADDERIYLVMDDMLYADSDGRTEYLEDESAAAGGGLLWFPRYAAVGDSFDYSGALEDDSYERRAVRGQVTYTNRYHETESELIHRDVIELLWSGERRGVYLLFARGIGLVCWYTADDDELAQSVRVYEI
jgi:hypothetical protein